MARYRVIVIDPNEPNRVLQKNMTDRCKLCVLNKTHELATGMAERKNREYKSVKWTVERLVGAPGQWEIIFHDRQNLGTLPVRHGH